MLPKISLQAHKENTLISTHFSRENSKGSFL